MLLIVKCELLHLVNQVLKFGFRRLIDSNELIGDAHDLALLVGDLFGLTGDEGVKVFFNQREALLLQLQDV